MPKVTKKSDDTPKNLKPFLFHGLDLSWNEGDANATGTCPFCGRDGKFSVLIETGQWRCLVCATGNERGGGNVAVFLNKLYEFSADINTQQEYFVEDRKLLYKETLTRWGVKSSLITGDILVPGYGTDGKLKQLYRYVEGMDNRKRLLATPNVNHQLFGDVNIGASTVIVCEGPWDAMALWEILGRAKVTDEGLGQTGSVASSLLADNAVIAVPGCSTFNEQWATLLAGKKVILMYDSDHARHENGKTVDGAGWGGMKRVALLLSRAEQPPESVECVYWGPEGFDPTLPSGHDVRDWLSSEDDLRGRIVRLGELLAKVAPIPEEWIAGRSKGSKRKGSVEIECLECNDWKTLQTSWRKALKWTDGLDRALVAMLSSCVSTMMSGDQLWLKIIGPAACGKSTLCEALSVNKKYVFANSTMTGIHSGWKSDSDGATDHGLVPKIRDKTLVIKDGDTLLQSASKDKTLSELRDLYDRVSRVHYANGVSREQEGVNMTLLLCGTSSLRALDSSELGERFLDCVIMDGIDDDLEDAILDRKVNQVVRNIGRPADAVEGGVGDPDLTQAMQLTGGFVRFLRENAAELLSAVDVPEEMRRRIKHYGKFVSYMRARPSSKQDESAERELASRLVTQLMRLACCMCAVLGKTVMDDEVDRRVRRIAMDTARGVTLNIVHFLREAGERGMVTKTLMVKTHQTEIRLRDLLKFLRRIGAVDYPEFKEAGLSGQHRWVLQSRFAALFDEVMAAQKEGIYG